MKRLLIVLGPLFCMLWFPGCGPRKATPAPPQVVEVPVVRGSNRGGDLGAMKRSIAPGADKYASALDAMLAQEQPQNPLPEGTRLLGLRVEGKKATIDLSAEFGNLNKQGDATESLAQRALRAVFAQFSEIATIDVTVEGKIFEGVHSGEWTDIPVRDEPEGGA